MFGFTTTPPPSPVPPGFRDIPPPKTNKTEKHSYWITWKQRVARALDQWLPIQQFTSCRQARDAGVDAAILFAMLAYKSVLPRRRKRREKAGCRRGQWINKRFGGFRLTQTPFRAKKKTMTVHLKDINLSLYECGVATGEEPIRESVRESFITIGRSQPILFLESSHAYLIQNTRLSNANRAYILSIIAGVLGEPGVIPRIDEQQALLTINLAIQEMLMTKDDASATENESSEAARQILVVLAKHDNLVHHVLDSVLQKFPPEHKSAPPHRFVPLTLAAVAQCNASGFLPFLTDILSRTAGLLPTIKNDALRSIWARTFNAFVEALIEHSSSLSASDSGVDSSDAERSGDSVNVMPLVAESLRRDYTDLLEVSLDSIINWLNSKDTKCRADVVEAAGSLLMMASTERVHKELKKFVTTFLQLHKKGGTEELLSMTKGMYYFLLRTCSDDAIPVDPYLDDICNSLFVHFVSPYDQSLVDEVTNPIFFRFRYEVCRCFLAASQGFGEKLVYFLLHKMQSVHDSTKLGAIDLLRYLLNSADSHMEDKRALIVMGLKPQLCDEALSIRVKSFMCQLCVALADHGYVHVDNGGENVIKFLTTNLIADLESGQISGKKGTSNLPSSTPLTPEITQLRIQSSQALCTIAKTCESSLELLWPHLLEFICAEAYSPVIAEVFKCIRVLVTKMIENGVPILFNFSADAYPRVAGIHQILTRIITCMSVSPLTPQTIARSREAARLLQVIGPSIERTLEDVFDSEVTSIIDTLHLISCPSEAASPSRHARLSTPDAAGAVDAKKAKVERMKSQVLQLLREICTRMATSEWLEALASAQGKQLQIYNKSPQDKAFLLECLGYTLSRITTDAFVREHIVLAFRSTNHSNVIERRGCASAVGKCAFQHTSLMLTELENIAKWEHSKKGSSGFFGFIKDAMPYGRQIDTQAVFLRASIVLSYGQLAYIMPVDFLPQRLEQTILPFLRQYMVDCKADVVVREAHLEAIHMIAKAVARIAADYRFEARYEMLSYIKEYVKSEEPETLSTWIRLFASKATTSLVNLPPNLSDNEIADLTTILSQHILTICREKGGLKTIDDDESSTTMEATVGEYRQAIAQMVIKRPILEIVCQMLKIFIPYFGSPADYERLRSIDITVLVLKLYFENAADVSIVKATDFTPLSGLLARLAPRIVDSVCAVRHLALHAVWLAFQLSFLHHGRITQSGLALNGGPAAVFDMDDFRETHLGFDGKLDAMKGRTAIATLAGHIEDNLPPCQLQTYISALFKMLGDKQNNVNSAAAQLLSVVLKDRGHILRDEGVLLVDMILEHLPQVHANIQTYTDLLNATTFYADHQLFVVVETLLLQPVPHSSSVSDVWKTLVHQPSQFGHVADLVIDAADCTAEENGHSEKPHSHHYDTIDLSGGCVVNLVNPHLCANMAALKEVINSGEPDDAVLGRMPQFFVTILHNLVAVIDVQYPSAIGASTGTSAATAVVPATPVVPPATGAGSSATSQMNGTSPTTDKTTAAVISESRKKKEAHIITAELKRLSTTPAGLVVDTLRTLLQRLKADTSIEAMNVERAWTHLVQPEAHISAIGVTCRSVCDHFPGQMRRVMEAVIGKTDSLCEYERISSAAILSSLITRCPKETGEFDEELIDRVVAELQHFARDKNLLVRKLAIRGYTAIGTLAQTLPNGAAIARKYANVAFEAALNGLDDAYDRMDEIAAESMVALDAVVPIIESAFIEKILSSLLLKLRPCFEKENSCLRAVAFRLFDKLAGVVGKSDVFKQNIHENMASLLLHLNDEDTTVSENCALAITHCEPLLGLDALSAIVADKLPDGKPPYQYAAFLKDVGMILTLSYPDRINFYALGCSNYFKSQVARIRSNAAMLTGYLLEPLTPALRGTLSRELVFTPLVHLLRDPCSEVRISTVRAIACLHSFS